MQVLRSLVRSRLHDSDTFFENVITFNEISTFFHDFFENVNKTNEIAMIFNDLLTFLVPAGLAGLASLAGLPDASQRPRCSQMVPRWYPDGTQMVPDGPRWYPYGPRWYPDGTQMD